MGIQEIRSDRPARHPGAPGWVHLLVLLTALVLKFPAETRAQTILNVERLQPGDVDGWHWGLQGEFSLSRGNNEYFDLLTGVIMGHRWADHWPRLFLGLDYRSETGEPLQNERYLHARYNYWLADHWQTFH